MLQPLQLWQTSHRLEQFGSLLFQLQDRKEMPFCLGATHEEVITVLLRDCLRSYRQLPMVVYQIQTKFRDEIRPRFGVMRAREFLMKDAYSFSVTPQETLRKTIAALRQSGMDDARTCRMMGISLQRLQEIMQREQT